MTLKICFMQNFMELDMKKYRSQKLCVTLGVWGLETSLIWRNLALIFTNLIFSKIIRWIGVGQAYNI